jgi:hypothetical protein
MRVITGISLAVLALGIMAVANPSRFTSASPAPVTPSAKILAVNQTELDKCKVLLSEISETTGVWESYKYQDRIGTVVVRSPFYDAPFDAKETLNSAFRCVMTEGRQDTSVDFIDYLDYRTHKTVAVWSPSLGFRVE